MWWSWKNKKIEKKRLVVLFDYENIILQPNFETVDFKQLQKRLLEISEISFAFIFVPFHCVYNLLRDRVNDFGFEIIVCQKRNKFETGVLEDTVDIDIIRMGIKFLNYVEITDIVIVSGDAHMIELVKEVKNKGKRIHIFGTNEIASCLINIGDFIEKVPTK